MQIARCLLSFNWQVINLQRNKNFNYLWLPNFSIFIPSTLRRAGKTQHHFTCRSARRPSQAGKPEVQFRFVELRPSACSCFPKKAGVHFLSELRLRFPSPPISRSFKTPKLNLAKAKVVNHQKYCTSNVRIWKRVTVNI